MGNRRIKDSLATKKKIAESRGYTLLEDKNFTTDTKIKLKHPDGYIWDVVWGNFVFGAKGKNGHSRRKPYEEVKETFTKEGYTLLTPKSEYETAAGKVKTRTPNGFIWYTTLTSFNQGRRCPKERVTSYGERVTWYLLNRLIPDEYSVRYEEYIVVDGVYLAIDFVVVNSNGVVVFAVEYNGKQHYEYCQPFHKTPEDFYKQQAIDEKKKSYCNDKGIEFIELPYTLDNFQILDKLKHIIPYKLNASIDFHKVPGDIRGFTRSDVVNFYKDNHTLQETADYFGLAKRTVTKYAKELDGGKIKVKHVKQIDPGNSAVINIFYNQEEARSALGISTGSLPKAIGKYTSKGVRKKCSGFQWDWASEEEYKEFQAQFITEEE